MPNMIVIKKDCIEIYLVYQLHEFNYSLLLYFYITKIFITTLEKQYTNVKCYMR